MLRTAHRREHRAAARRAAEPALVDGRPGPDRAGHRQLRRQRARRHAERWTPHDRDAQRDARTPRSCRPTRRRPSARTCSWRSATPASEWTKRRCSGSSSPSSRRRPPARDAGSACRRCTASSSSSRATPPWRARRDAARRSASICRGSRRRVVAPRDENLRGRSPAARRRSCSSRTRTRCAVWCARS